MFKTIEYEIYKKFIGRGLFISFNVNYSLMENYGLKF